MAKQQLSKRSFKTGHMGGLLASVSVLALMMASGPAKAELPCGMDVFSDTNVVNVEETLSDTCTITLKDGAVLRLRNVSISGNETLRIEDANNGGGFVEITSSEFNINDFGIFLDNEVTINSTQIVASSGLSIGADHISVANADFDAGDGLTIIGDRVRVVSSALSENTTEIRIIGNDDLHVINNVLDESTPRVRISGSPTGQANIIGNTIDARFSFRIDTGDTRMVGNHIVVTSDILRIAIVSGRVQNNVLTLDSQDIRISAANDIYVQGNEFNSPTDGVRISGAPCTIKQNTDNTIDGIDTSGCI